MLVNEHGFAGHVLLGQRHNQHHHQPLGVTSSPTQDWPNFSRQRGACRPVTRARDVRKGKSKTSEVAEVHLKRMQFGSPKAIPPFFERLLHELGSQLSSFAHSSTARARGPWIHQTL